MELRKTNQQVTPYERQARCGVKLEWRQSLRIEREGEEGLARFAGLCYCGSRSACPPCAWVKNRRDAADIRQALGAHEYLGGGHVLLTLTMPHDAGDRLKPLRQHVARAWQCVVRAAPWQRLKARLGIVGFVRRVELTHGPNGWHPHVHAVVFTRRPLTDAQRQELEEFAFRRWAKAIAQPHRETGRRFRAPLRDVGARVTQLSQADYIAKLGLADELGSSETKAARDGHRAPFQILHDMRVAELSNPTDNALWDEHLREMHGAQALTWSRGLRRRYADQTALGLVERKEPKEVLYEIPDAIWDGYLAHYVQRQKRILHFFNSYPRDEAADRTCKLLDRLAGFPEVPF